MSMKIHLATGLRAMSLALACGAAMPVAMAAAPPAAAFAQPPSLNNVVPSPSGRRLAMIVSDPKDGRRALAVVDLPAKSTPRVVASFGDADVRSVSWVNDDRLIYRAYQIGAIIRDGGGGTFAVDHDGNNATELIAFTRASGAQAGSRIVSRSLSLEWSVISAAPVGHSADVSDWPLIEPAPGGSGRDVFVREMRVTTGGEPLYGKLARLDTLSGRLSTILVGAPENVQSWVFDREGEPMVARTFSGGRDRLYVRKPGTETWDKFSDLPLRDSGAMEPLFLEGSDELIVSTLAGKATTGLYAFNLKTRKLDPEPLARAERYDIDEVVADRQQRSVMAAEVKTDRVRSLWFSGRMAALQKSLDASLPAGRSNRIVCTRCEGAANYVVFSQSDREPGEYYVFDAATRNLQLLGRTRPWIDPESQGQRSMHWIAARDGLPLPVIVTHPPGSKPNEALPTVVLVHGGPWVPGAQTAWEPEAQFLATRGWRVIEPQFRGTLGYGERHFKASFRQWGQSMQDDLADATNWAVKEGLADAKRVCIYGASYGGYAALMGPVKHPALYRCAASFVGVTDIMLMFTNTESDMSREWKLYGMPEMIGDPKADRKMLEENSPVLRVADIKVPVLLGVGLLDRRVPPAHADAFESAARKAGVAVQRINYSEAAHGFARAEDGADFWQQLATFLDRSLKP
jgi:dipeptidyl aminopeptidase/acylaminoacyl peptidase